MTTTRFLLRLGFFVLVAAVPDMLLGDGPLDVCLALVRGDISNDGGDIAIVKVSDRQNIDGHNLCFGSADSRRNLCPSSGSCTQVQYHLCFVQDGILLVDLRQLEGRTRSQALLLGHCAL